MKRSFKHMRWLAPLALGALVGCETNPITGRSQFMVVSQDMAIGQSAAAYSSMMGDLGKKKKSKRTRRAPRRCATSPTA
jgi:hypothetical protein